MFLQLKMHFQVGYQFYPIRIENSVRIRAVLTTGPVGPRPRGPWLGGALSLSFRQGSRLWDSCKSCHSSAYHPFQVEFSCKHAIFEEKYYNNIANISCIWWKYRIYFCEWAIRGAHGKNWPRGPFFLNPSMRSMCSMVNGFSYQNEELFPV